MSIISFFLLMFAGKRGSEQGKRQTVAAAAVEIQSITFRSTHHGSGTRT